MGMASRKIGPGGVPNLSTEEIEAEIDKMKAEGARTEAWMTARARKQMHDLEERDAALRGAYEAGYRAGSETGFLTPIFGVVCAGAIIGVAWLVREFVMPLF